MIPMKSAWTYMQSEEIIFVVCTLTREEADQIFKIRRELALHLLGTPYNQGVTCIERTMTPATWLQANSYLPIKKID